MHKSATKCNKTIGKWCKNKHGASKIIDTFETYQISLSLDAGAYGTREIMLYLMELTLTSKDALPNLEITSASICIGLNPA
jgi:hypothetical protein